MGSKKKLQSGPMALSLFTGYYSGNFRIYLFLLKLPHKLLRVRSPYAHKKDHIPQGTTSSTKNLPTVFSNLHESLQQVLWQRLGWKEIREVQEETYPAVADGSDVLVIAPTAGGNPKPRSSPLWTIS